MILRPSCEGLDWVRVGHGGALEYVTFSSQKLLDRELIGASCCHQLTPRPEIAPEPMFTRVRRAFIPTVTNMDGKHPLYIIENKLTIISGGYQETFGDGSSHPIEDLPPRLVPSTDRDLAGCLHGAKHHIECGNPTGARSVCVAYPLHVSER
jgi:hypothetical protein